MLIEEGEVRSWVRAFTEVKKHQTEVEDGRPWPMEGWSPWVRADWAVLQLGFNEAGLGRSGADESGWWWWWSVVTWAAKLCPCRCLSDDEDDDGDDVCDYGRLELVLEGIVLRRRSGQERTG